MTTISINLEENLKNKFLNVSNKIGLKSEKALLLIINKFIENPNIINNGVDKNLNSDIFKIGENSFSEVWDNEEDEIYSNLYKNV